MDLKTICVTYTEYYEKLGLVRENKNQEICKTRFYATEYFCPKNYQTHRPKTLCGAWVWQVHTAGYKPPPCRVCRTTARRFRHEYTQNPIHTPDWTGRKTPAATRRSTKQFTATIPNAFSTFAPYQLAEPGISALNRPPWEKLWIHTTISIQMIRSRSKLIFRSFFIISSS